MFFISRVVHDPNDAPPSMPRRHLYGVVDTNDGIEQIVTWAELSLACAMHNIHVFGACSRYENEVVFSTYSIVPYQPRDTMTVIQVKTSVLKHVDVTTYKEWVTGIGWRPDDLKEAVSLRLSDFGSKVADYSLQYREGCKGPSVTLILDDKISVAPHSFDVLNSYSLTASSLGVIFDIREVSSSEFVKDMYSKVSSAYIVDTEERKNYMLDMLWKELQEDLGCFI